jgi:type II secretory pathway pseudopilin PulG
MKKASKIHAFTLMEFAIAMLISTLIVGMLLYALFYLNKGNSDYVKQLSQYETGFDLITRIHFDMFRCRKASFENEVLMLDNAFAGSIEYQFEDNIIIRSMDHVVDTFSIGSYTVDLNYYSEDQHIPVSLVIYLKDVTNESIAYTFECNQSTDIYISSTHGY